MAHSSRSCSPTIPDGILTHHEDYLPEFQTLYIIAFGGFTQDTQIKHWYEKRPQLTNPNIMSARSEQGNRSKAEMRVVTCPAYLHSLLAKLGRRMTKWASRDMSFASVQFLYTRSVHSFGLQPRCR